MLSAVFIYNQKGEVLISRLYRHDVKRSVADVFRVHVISSPSAVVRSPVTTLGSTSFFHIRYDNLWLCAVAKNNASAAMVFEFLYRLLGLGVSYFGRFDEEAVKSNFVLIYELLDEILDFGYPQNMEVDTLKLYVTTESVRSRNVVEGQVPQSITMQATGSTTWRRNDIVYKKNEAFVDVIESVNLILSAKGTVLRADVQGQIVMRSFLSGMPECKFGLNDKLVLDRDAASGALGRSGGGSGALSSGSRSLGTRAGGMGGVGDGESVEIADCQFHQCVRLGRFDTDRTISFIPPDGEFELMRYRTTENVNLPFKVLPVVRELGKSCVEYEVLIKSNFSSKLSATNMAVSIPTPPNATKCRIKVTGVGKAKYHPEENAIVWKISRFQGLQETSLTAVVDLAPMAKPTPWSRPPISLDFQVLMFTASGLLVRFLKVFERSNYQSVKWVRYMTKAGSYEIRI
ncbi:clathrin associated protein complex medium subunit [Coemansia sp. RSA 1722]|nr:clathrin associated protein complex medium subunit [Coemansia sp. RSA 486]KAJ2237901.1 clathrin associated protein complex medium subunit [Coemansia sp. RSA 485]KAJ2599133.1 clathrin associated protein complex medium subunit [Coemansia sp. RSA 1721]KAJ2606070.1 clathrin associated protein complex medium subunit [Coemansia sp. RSA 1722]KAJ2636578.1 clathrin associated protein complex medium subunit [Coemansia sp. RSA 1286]KAJ2706641.1 clathrin associated protein complex medium subunit [Coema